MTKTGSPPHPYLARPRPWLVAHRGGARLAPENTLVAFDLARDLGADAIETDVHLSKDGEVIVFHDDDTLRLCGVPGTIEGRTREEIGALDAAFSFSPDGGATQPLRGRGVHPPTLAETLARYPGMRFNVEAKSADPALAAALVRTLREAGRLDDVCIGSFDDAQGERLRVLAPDACHFLPTNVATCHVLAAKSGNTGNGCPEGYLVADLPLATDGFRVVDGEVVAHFRRLGIAVFVWTVDREEDMRDVLALGIHGVMTDRPDVLKSVLGR
jgi:glycerophosphoryl diester phosphodiesterase